MSKEEVCCNVEQIQTILNPSYMYMPPPPPDPTSMLDLMASTPLHYLPRDEEAVSFVASFLEHSEHGNPDWSAGLMSSGHGSHAQEMRSVWSAGHVLLIIHHGIESTCTYV